MHRFTIESVLKGEVPVEIDVASTPQTCNGPAGAFPQGDPLDRRDRVELFLFEVGGQFQLVTPWDGVVAAPEGQPLPWEPEG